MKTLINTIMKKTRFMWWLDLVAVLLIALSAAITIFSLSFYLIYG